MPQIYQALRPVLFRLDPEVAHALTLGLLRLVAAIPSLAGLVRHWYCTDDKPVDVLGLHFKNPVGLAAGYDKDGLGWRGLACLGFGHIEVGTVTPRAQSGNPRPRLFRLPDAQALINRMGFPGKGAQFLANRISGNRPPGLVLGVNLGINKDTPLESAADDYVQLLHEFASLADYLVVNVSSPNTLGLRRLQARYALEELLNSLAEERAGLVGKLKRHTPLLVKLSPDLDDAELDDALDIVIQSGMDGVVATNTTLSRDGLSTPTHQQGGLSGSPLRVRSTQMIATISRRVGSSLTIIGVGGIMSPADAIEKLEAGASLVQVYSGLVYAGPGLVKQILLCL